MKADLRWSVGAVMALHCTSEDYCITLFELSHLAAMHAKQVTLIPKDIRLVQTIRRVKSMLDRPMEVNLNRCDHLNQRKQWLRVN